MHLVTLLAVAAGLLAFVQLVVFLQRLIFSPTRRVPGPFLAHFTDGWYLWRVSKARFEYDNIDLHQKYGDVVRYGPNRFSIGNPAASRTIYGLGAHFAKSDWYQTFSSPGSGHWSLFADQSIQRHAENRRQYQAMYSLTSLVTYEPYVNECADLFSTRLTEIANGGMPINMAHWFQCYAFDVIGLITYSKRLGFLDRGEDVSGVMHALEDHFVYASLVGIYSFLHPYLFALRNWWYSWFAGKAGAGRMYIMSFTKERIAEHQANPKAMPAEVEVEDGKESKSVDFLTKFFFKHGQNPNTFTMYHVLAGCTSNMVAGADTTAVSLSSVLYYLLKNPQTFQKLREEVDNYQRAKGSNSPYITFKESQEMPYLQAVMKEALRMHPAVGLPLERVVPQGGATILDQFFPEGSIVGINAWVMHRNKHVYGDDCNEFKPERWLIDDAEKLAFMERHNMAFGAGSRTCIGRHISFLEMSKLIPRLVRDFDFELEGNLRQKDALWRTENYWFVVPKDFKVKINIREKGMA